MKTFKRVISLLLVSCLLFCAVPSAFAAESAGTATVAETEEEDILDNPIFTGAIKDIVVSFIQSFTEIFQRYVEIIKAIILSIEIPEIPETPETPEVPGTGDAPETGEDVPAVDTPADDGNAESGEEALQPAA